jgi:hypothetical protein
VRRSTSTSANPAMNGGGEVAEPKVPTLTSWPRPAKEARRRASASSPTSRPSAAVQIPAAYRTSSALTPSIPAAAARTWSTMSPAACRVARPVT